MNYDCGDPIKYLIAQNNLTFRCYWFINFYQQLLKNFTGNELPITALLDMVIALQYSILNTNKMLQYCNQYCNIIALFHSGLFMIDEEITQ